MMFLIMFFGLFLLFVGIIILNDPTLKEGALFPVFLIFSAILSIIIGCFAPTNDLNQSFETETIDMCL